MKLTINSNQIDSLKTACIEHEYDVQIHETDEPQIVHAYVMNRGRGLTDSQAFWLGCWFTADLSEEKIGRREQIAQS